MNRDNHRNQDFFAKHRDLWLCLLLVLSTLAVYWQIQNYDFVNIDDNFYVYDNRQVQSGLALESLVWSFTTGTTVSNYWMPLTWLSHMLDFQLYGLNPAAHHWTSLLFHALNAVLLFFVLKKMTGAWWRSGFVAALFAVHPLHVESVAWVSMRKDVLSTFFWLLAMGAYARYAEKPGLGRYFPVLLLFVLGLMSKPMLVTLPFVLLLLDFWPLSRMPISPAISTNNPEIKTTPVSVLIGEKIPFLALSAVAAAAALIYQQKGGAVPTMDLALLKVQTANALVSYVIYIKKMIWPSRLAVFYPHPGTIPVWQAMAAGILLVCVTVFFVRSGTKRPYLPMGWFWYLGTLVPVIGLVKIGGFAMADRYTYVSFIGLFVLVAWGVADLAARWRHRKIVLAALAAVLLSILSALTWKQVGCWENSRTLFEHTLKVTSDNWLAHNNLGAALSEQGRMEEAVAHYSKALWIKPEYADARINLGLALEKQGRIDEAIDHFVQVLRTKPDHVGARFNLGNVLMDQGRIDVAGQHYLEVLRLKPDHVEARNNLGKVIYKQGRIEEAMGHFSQVRQIMPDHAEAHYNFAKALYRLGRSEEAMSHYLHALRIEPDNVDLHVNLGAALAARGRTDDAIEHYLKALRIKPDHVEAHYNLGAAYFRKGNIHGAIEQFQAVLKINPDDDTARNNLKKLLSMPGGMNSNER
jgi:tetratricopeptide (TPR) repeat protein